MDNIRPVTSGLLTGDLDSWLCLNTKSFLSLLKGQLSDGIVNQNSRFIYEVTRNEANWSCRYAFGGVIEALYANIA